MKRINKLKLTVGQKVTYNSPNGKKEKGIVKSVSPNGNGFIVYNCNNEWDNYKNYTGQYTLTMHLTIGWDEE